MKFLGSIVFLCLGFSVTAQGVGNLDFINWNDTLEASKTKLEEFFGAVTQEEGSNTLTSQGTFSGEVANISLQFNTAFLEKIEVILQTEGEGSEAYIGYERVYATLQELYGSPSSISLWSGERKWSFDDGSFMTLTSSRTEREESRKTKGTLSGQGTLKGQTRTLGRDGGRTEADYTLDLNPAFNAEGLKWDGEQVIKLLTIKTVVIFSAPKNQPVETIPLG